MDSARFKRHRETIAPRNPTLPYLFTTCSQHSPSDSGEALQIGAIAERQEACGPIDTCLRKRDDQEGKRVGKSLLSLCHPGSLFQRWHRPLCLCKGSRQTSEEAPSCRHGEAADCHFHRRKRPMSGAGKKPSMRVGILSFVSPIKRLRATSKCRCHGHILPRNSGGRTDKSSLLQGFTNRFD